MEGAAGAPSRRLSIGERELLQLIEDHQQLMVEVNMEQMPLSETVKELVTYIQKETDTDRLVKGFSAAADNPFGGEKGGCTLL